MSVFRGIHWVVILVVLAFFSLDAGRDLYNTWKQPAPLAMDCAAYLKAPPPTGWLDLQNCTLDYASRRRTHNYDKNDSAAVDDDNYVPVRAGGGPIVLLLKVSPEESAYLNALPQNPDPVQRAGIARHLQALSVHRHLRGELRSNAHILTGTQLALETSGLTLAPQWSVLLPDDPVSLYWTVPFVLAPFVLVALLGWRYWPRRKEAAPAAAHPQPVPGASRRSGPPPNSPQMVMIVVAVLVSMVLAFFAGKIFYIAWRAPAPVVMACQDYLRDQPDVLWVDLRDCTLDYNLLRRTFSTEPGLKSTDKNFVPVVRTLGQADIRLFLQASDAESEYLNMLPDNPTPAQAAAIAARLRQLMFHRRIQGMIQTSLDSDDTVRNAMVKSHLSLAPDWKIIEEKAPLSVRIANLLVFGALLGAVFALWLYRRRPHVHGS